MGRANGNARVKIAESAILFHNEFSGTQIGWGRPLSACLRLIRFAKMTVLIGVAWTIIDLGFDHRLASEYFF